MSGQPGLVPPTSDRRFPVLPALFVVVAIFGCSIYANLSFTVTNPANYRFFPPFLRGVNANDNRHLGAEYFNIARSLAAGRGFASPFGEPTGPTAWMPPVLPVVLAGLLVLCGGNVDLVMGLVIFLQVYVLIGTGLLVLALTRRTAGHVGPWAAAVVYLGALTCNFHLWFQFTHDGWIILLAVDLLIAGCCWARPLGRTLGAAGWGLFGGLCALVSPVVGLAWGVGTLLLAVRQGAWRRFALAGLAAALALVPWTVRNVLVFGRLIPVKSNLAYELYQSQCLQRDGLLRSTTFASHPYVSGGRERREYQALGEMAYLDQKRELFRQAVAKAPLDFAERLARRVLGVTVWYVPFDHAEVRQPWVLWASRLTHPLPFLAVLVLVFTGARRPLGWPQGVVIAIYLAYLLPYVAASYYIRYALPLVGAQALLVLWAADRLLGLGRRAVPAVAEEETPAPTPRLAPLVKSALT